MSNTIVAFMFAAAGSVWLYTRLMRKTGNNTKNSLVASAVVGLLVFLAIIIIMNAFF